jgi:hypothetical protein
VYNICGGVGEAHDIVILVLLSLRQQWLLALVVIWVDLVCVFGIVLNSVFKSIFLIEKILKSLKSI